MAVASHPDFDAPGGKCSRCGTPRTVVIAATRDDIGKTGIACPPNTGLTQSEFESIEEWKRRVDAITAELAGAARRGG